MMDIEEFCDGYFYGDSLNADEAVEWFKTLPLSGNTLTADDFSEKLNVSIEEVSEDAKKYFGTSMAKDHAIAYLTKTLGEF